MTSALDAFMGRKDGVWERASNAVRAQLGKIPFAGFRARIQSRLTRDELEEVNNIIDGKKLGALNHALIRKLWVPLSLDVGFALGEMSPDQETIEKWKSEMSRDPLCLAGATRAGASQECHAAKEDEQTLQADSDVKTYIFVRASEEFLFGE